MVIPVKITVTGGKGGTGKSTVATNLALLLAMNRRVVFVDADVECPNDHILLSAELENRKEVYLFKPKFDYSKCTKCGLCVENCAENALLQFKEGYPFLMPSLCSGCRTCQLVCPEEGAILDDQRLVGYTYHTRIDENLQLLTGMLEEGDGEGKEDNDTDVAVFSEDDFQVDPDSVLKCPTAEVLRELECRNLALLQQFGRNLSPESQRASLS